MFTSKSRNWCSLCLTIAFVILTMSAFSANPQALRTTPSTIGVVISVGDTVEFVLNAQDSDGDLAGCEWHYEGNFVESNVLFGANDSDNWSATFVSTGEYTVEGIVYDLNWNYSYPVVWTVFVDVPINHPINEFFDDFSYGSYSDSNLTNFGWHIVDGISGPPANAFYNKENITFSQDPDLSTNQIMSLTTETNNTFASMELTRIESPFIFLEGTYAARVFFDNNPENYQDGNVETFYTINVLNFPNDPDYAEIDFEYLPYNVWGDGDYRNNLYMTAWETYQFSPWDPNNASNSLIDDFSGWHTLVFQAVDGSRIDYYVDGVFHASQILSTKNDSVYPETPMQISFANWIWSGPNEIGLGDSSVDRSCTMMVDWVFHAKNAALNPAEVEYLVNDFRSNSTPRLNTMDDTLSTGIPTFSKDLNVFPNPTSSIVHVELEGNTSNRKFQILNLNGQTVVSGNTGHERMLKLDLSSLHDGIYVLRIDNQRVKIVKQN